MPEKYVLGRGFDSGARYELHLRRPS
jgi:hypothetical protein